MRILIVANYYPNRGGISSVVSNHFAMLTAEGYYVKIFNTKKNPIVRILIMFSLIIKVKRFDIIHIHGCSGLGFYPIIIGIISSKIFSNKKAIVTYHGGAANDFLRKYSVLIIWFLKKANRITVMSNYLKEVFNKYNIETTILNNLVNIEIGSWVNKDFSMPKLISIRTLSKIYNIEDVIVAFHIIRSGHKYATLKIAGNGEQYVQLKRKYGSFDGIDFLGFIPNNCIPELIKSCNIFISVPSYDNQPISILEAFAGGCLVISSNVGGVPDMIEDGINGFLVDVNNPDQIAQKIEWIISNPDLAKKIVEKGKALVKNYLWPSIKPKLLEIYKN